MSQPITVRNTDAVIMIVPILSSCSMMETCGITDYSINDLTAPTAKRLRRQLSGIINFAKFREERLTLLADLTMQRDFLTDQRDRQSKLGNETFEIFDHTSMHVTMWYPLYEKVKIWIIDSRN